MRPSKIKAKLRRNEPVLVTTVHFTDPSAYEMVSLMGVDGIWLDLEHHGTSVETASQLLRAARVGTADVMVRPANKEFMRLGRILEAGAQGIMYPRCQDAAEAREVVKWSKFAPLGQRGVDSGNADNPYCLMPLKEYLKAANDETFVVIQLEDAQSVANAESIAAVEGVDLIFLGPGDFSVLAGVPGEYDHPIVQEAIRTVAAGAKAAGKPWGMPAGTPERAKQLLDMGAKFIAHGADLLWLKAGVESMRQQFTPLGFQFDGRY
jgi:4-hydroxy-2-oxoheptanedioate aldolase